MADGQKLNNEQVALLKKEIVGKYESVQQQLKRLQGTLDTMEVNWRGVGAHAFDKKQTELNERMQAIGRILVDFLEGISGNEKLTDGLEDQVRSTMDSIDVQYGGKHSAINSY
ncbi:WXG100 family type VII secretion target [Streptomyces sp. NBC_01381]|uniref:WXG100 family type VII secretion target n=1 Tax=Streptomyces sp. NBC_01381 TaxID=2903845 RepID=UPI00225B8A45|nr:WXG100 family type VII secretion target [Streptomyces sp. NBC_01381]MCX4670413.1 WXG100 family type VII secretion target [Streptomyces sp. NBC_01381]